MSQINRVKLVIAALFISGCGAILFTNNFINRPVMSFSSGPPPGRTGAPAEDTCEECHLRVGTSTGSLTITAPQTYLPGQTYQLTVRHSSSDQTRQRWGFELTALDSGDQKAGELQTNGDGLTQLRSNEDPHPDRQYIEHTAAATAISSIRPSSRSIRPPTTRSPSRPRRASSRPAARRPTTCSSHHRAASQVKSL